MSRKINFLFSPLVMIDYFTILDLSYPDFEKEKLLQERTDTGQYVNCCGEVIKHQNFAALQQKKLT